MLILNSNLPKEYETIEIHIFADEHIGDPQCDYKRLLSRIAYIRNTPNAYCILNGDLMDNATTTSLGDTYTATISPKEQLDSLYGLFNPIKDKILTITQGNHENRTYKKEGLEISGILANYLGIPHLYSPTSSFLFIRFGTPKHNKGRNNYQLCYTLYCLHGCGGGRKEGAKINRLTDMSSIVDADIYLHSHTHLPAIIKNSYFRVNKSNLSVNQVDRLFINNAANMNYGGYGEAQEYKPNSKSTPVIYLNGREKEMVAKL